VSGDWPDLSDLSTASVTTARAIVMDLQNAGLDALFDPVTQRRLRRTNAETREAIRRMLPNFTFNERTSS
jgi:hypothetical protein